MMSIDEIKARLKTMLTPKRYDHSVRVMEASAMLARRYGEDVEKAELAGLIHDCAKDMDKNTTFALCKKYDIIPDDIMQKHPELLHGTVGSFVARDLFGVDCPRVLAAVADHTMGRENMDRLSSIVFIADYIEAGRTFEGVGEIRKASEKSLEAAIVAGVDSTIRHILKKGGLIHPQTILTRNWALEQMKSAKGGLQQPGQVYPGQVNKER